MRNDFHRAVSHDSDPERCETLLADWARIRALRDDVNKALEDARGANQIGSALQEGAHQRTGGGCGAVATFGQ